MKTNSQDSFETDAQIKFCWTLCGIALLTAWAFPPAYALYALVIILMVRRVCTENDHAKFESASLLLLSANVSFLCSVMLAASTGHGIHLLK